MSKMCLKCQNTVEDNVHFCPSCGSSDFAQIESGSKTVLNTNGEYSSQENYNSSNMNMQQKNTNLQYSQNQPVSPIQSDVSFQPSTPKKKKRIKGWLIALIIFGAFVLGYIGGENLFQQLGYGDSNSGQMGNNSSRYSSTEDKNNSNNVSNLAYTKGTLSKDGIYTNNWADIKLVIPDGFSIVDTSTDESSTTDFGVYLMSDDKMSLMYICYERLPSFRKYDEESYLNSAMNELNMQSALNDITYQTADTYTTDSIAGYAYEKAVCSLNNGYGDFVQSIYVRKLDNYMICISAVSVSEDSNDSLINRITTVD